MSIALYRKYRPATFGQVRGQEHVTDPLRQALSNGRINHAYLFSGPRGCGKTTSARILARSLNCVEGPTPDPCGLCDSCVSLAPDGGGSLDVIEIDAASHGGVDDARDLRERAFFAPVSSRYKIYVIDEAHMVTREGFNALLKLVEEPPPHLKFVFATTEPEKVIGTIRSRTHHYPFRLIPPSTLKELMEDLLTEEGIGYDPAALPLVVRAGGGSARDSLSVLDQLIAGSSTDGITREGAVSLLGYTDTSLLGEMVDALGARDGGAAFGLIDRVVESGHDPRRFTADLLERFRDLVVLAAVPDALDKGLLNVSPESVEQMKEQATRLGPAELTRAADILNQGLTEMRGATAPRLLLELMCARILLPGTDGDQGVALLTRLEQMERQLASGAAAAPAAPAQPATASPAPAPAPPAAAETAEQAAQPAAPPPAPQQGRPSPQSQQPSAPDSVASSEPAGWSDTTAAPAASASPSPASTGGGALELGRVQGAWGQILEAVKKRRRFTWMVLTGGDVRPVGVEGDTVLLQFPRPNDVKGFANSGSDQVVAAAIQQVLGTEVRVAAGGQNGSAAKRPEPAPQAAAESARSRAEPAGWDAPAPEPAQSAQPGEPEQPSGPAASAQSAEPAPPSAPEPPETAGSAPPSQSEEQPAGGPPPEKIVTGLQEPPPDPFEDAAAAPPPEPSAAEPPPAPVREPAPEERAPEDTPGEQQGVPGAGASLIESELGGQVIDEIQHGAQDG